MVGFYIWLHDLDQGNGVDIQAGEVNRLEPVAFSLMPLQNELNQDKRHDERGESGCR